MSQQPKDPPLFAIVYLPFGASQPGDVAYFERRNFVGWSARQARKFTTAADAECWLDEEKESARGYSHVVGLLPERDGGIAQEQEAGPPAGETEATGFPQLSTEDQAAVKLLRPSQVGANQVLRATPAPLGNMPVLAPRRGIFRSLGPSGPEKRCGVPGVPGNYQPPSAFGQPKQ